MISRLETLIKPEETPKTQTSLVRQSSIYSLTLDEFQNTLCDNGKNFGSMNMDEFLSNIWTAEENQAALHHTTTAAATTTTNHLELLQSLDQEDPTRMTKTPLVTQPSLHRQGSLSLPAPLCQKTVEEVWSEIQRDQQQEEQQNPNKVGTTTTTTTTATSGTTASRQATFGEMTLEDFLIKAGVVREACGPNFGIGIGLSDHHQITGNGVSGGIPVYHTVPQNGGVVADKSLNYGRDGKTNGGFPADVCFGRRVGNGGGFGGSPVSPVSSDGMCTNQVDNSVSQYSLEMGGIRGRRRIIDGPVEVVVERRQRRMIKNRESAARSRARKQAYTVELEAALNQLQEENARLKQTLEEAEKKRKLELLEEMKKKPPTKVQKTRDKLRLLRRTSSTPK